MGKVAVVGGSVAGLYAALLLARRGARVRLFEGARGSVAARRSLIVTAAYRDLLGSLGESAVVAEVQRFRLFAGPARATVPLERADLVIERSELMRSLTAAALDAGAQIERGRWLEGLAPAGDAVELRFRDGTAVRADTVIGADGLHSCVARLAGWAEQPSVPLVQAVVGLPAGSDRFESTVWFEPAETPYFYWLIPHSDSEGVLGIIGIERARARASLDGFAARHDLDVRGYQGAMIPEYAGWRTVGRRLGRGRVYLVGDAAGHVKVTTVGGIVDGLWGAEGVCERIAPAGAPRHRSLARLRLELGLHLTLRRVLNRFGPSQYEQLLGTLGTAGTRTLARYHRDDTLALLAHLAVRRPRLAWLALSALGRGLRTRSWSAPATVVGTPGRGRRGSAVRGRMAIQSRALHPGD